MAVTTSLVWQGNRMPLGLTPVDAVDEANWFISALSEDYTVDGLVPSHFPAYARILHPAYASVDDRPVPWSEIADAEGTTLHAHASYDALTRHKSERRTRWDLSDPEIATLDDRRLAVLVDILASHTRTPQTIWLNLWDGFGGTPAAWRGHPRVVQGGGYREYYLFTCALDQIVDASAGFSQWPPDEDDEDEATTVISAVYVDEGEPPEDPPPDPDAPGQRIQSPQQWWPDDRAWAIATEVDDDYTVVAGNEDLIAEILAHPGLETFRVAPRDSWEDTINQA